MCVDVRHGDAGDARRDVGEGTCERDAACLISTG